MKRHLTTILLVLAAVGLSVYLWRDRDHITETERRARESSVFPAWRKDELTYIQIAHEGETLILQRANKEQPWRMTSPREERVDQQAVERFSATLEFAGIVRKVGEGDQLGFDRARATGEVKMGAVSFRFALGSPTPRPEGSGYFKVDDGAPFVVSKEVAEALLASSDTYRDRSVVPYLSLDLKAFELTHPKGAVTLERLDDRSFLVKVDDGKLLAARKELDRIWGALAEMRAESFPKDADADRLTANPQMTIRMTPKEAGKGAAVLVIGEACPGHPDDVVVLRKEPTRGLACAPKGALDRLLKIEPRALVDKAAFGFRHDEIEELRLEGGEQIAGSPSAGAIEIARRGPGFHLREPTDRELSTQEAEAANELLVQLERDHALSVRSNAKASFKTTGKAKVRVADYEEVVEVGDVGESGHVLVHRLRDDALLEMSALQARRLRPRETTLRPLALLPKETRRVTRVALRCGVDQDFTDTGEGLRLVKPEGYETDGSITQLVDGLLRGKAHEWTADRDDGSFGIKPGGCRAVLSFEDGNSPATVFLGFVPERLEVFGSIDGERGVFVPDAVLPSMMKKIYVSRAALRIDPATEEITVKVNGRAVPGDLARRRKAAAAFDDATAWKVGSSDVGQVEIEITSGVPEAGAPHRIVCGAAKDGTRECSNPAVKVVFHVPAKGVDDFVSPPRGPAISDAGRADAR